MSYLLAKSLFINIYEFNQNKSNFMQKFTPMAKLPLVWKSFERATHDKSEMSQPVIMSEKIIHPVSGYQWLILHLSITIAGLYAVNLKGFNEIGLLCLCLSIVMFFGYFVVNPSEARLILQMGEYMGTVKQSGFYWVLPYCRKLKISLKTYSFVSEILQTSDAKGDAILISATIIWKIQDTAKALFQISDFQSYIKSKSLSVLKNVAAAYPLEAGENQPSLRLYSGALGEAMRKELQQKLLPVGLWIEEARITHLVYSPEILSEKSKNHHINIDNHIKAVAHTLKKMEEQQLISALNEEQKAHFAGELFLVMQGK
jgi:regulator of protease activity HflC (stomatin/prohibitin superfamily)